jgi:hypothetical protein
MAVDGAELHTHLLGEVQPAATFGSGVGQGHAARWG